MLSQWEYCAMTEVRLTLAASKSRLSRQYWLGFAGRLRVQPALIHSLARFQFPALHGSDSCFSLKKVISMKPELTDLISLGR